MERLLGNFRTKLLAAGIGLALWGVVVYAENPTETRTYYLTVEPGPLPQGMILMGDLPKVAVTVVAPAETLRAFDAKTGLRVTASLSNLRRGANTVPIRVDRLDQNVTIRRAPDTIAVLADELRSDKRTVVIERLRKLPAGFHEVSATVTPKEVTLLGPQSQLPTAEAVVQVDLEGKQFVDGQFTVVVRDPEKKRLDKVGVAPAEVAVKIVIQADLIAQAKPVGARLNGQPAAGYRVSNITVSPITVTVSGLPATLDGLQLLDTDPVDVSNATGDVVRTVNLRVPGGVAEISPKQVSVHVFVERNPLVSPPPSPTPTPTPRP